MPKPSFLMCRPSFYGVNYEINPWMSLRRQPDRRRALSQWQALRQTLERDLGARVHLVPARPGLPDMTFTANAGLARGKTFIAARFAYKERAGEEPHFKAWFRRRKWRVIAPPEGQSFEGAGDALFLGDTLIAGYLVRSKVQPHAFIGSALRVPVLSLPLVNPWFYHLDTCFCPLGAGRAVWYPDAFDAYGRRVLREHAGDLIAVRKDEAYQFACNMIVVGRQAVICDPARQLERQLRARGYAVHRRDFSEFIKAGGAAKCLTLRIG